MPNKKQGPGRPKGREKIKQSISFPLSLLSRLRDYAKWTGQSISAVVTKAVTRYLDNPDQDDIKKG